MTKSHDNTHVLFVSAWQSGSVKTVSQPWSDYNGINRVEWFIVIDPWSFCQNKCSMDNVHQYTELLYHLMAS